MFYQIGYQDWVQAWNLTGEQDTAWNSTVVMIPYNYMLSYYGFRYPAFTLFRISGRFFAVTVSSISVLEVFRILDKQKIKDFQVWMR